MSHAHSFKEIPDNFFYSFTRELSELKWSQYYAMLDSALRPYFTLSDEFYKNCEICHLYKENFDMDFKLVEINKNAALNADTTPSASVKVEEKKEDPLWWVAFTVTVGAAGCVIASWLTK